MAKQLKFISKEEWIIRLMQGMVGNYGMNKSDNNQCYYDGLSFKRLCSKEGYPEELNINYLFQLTDFWITDTKGIPMEPITLSNIPR